MSSISAGHLLEIGITGTVLDSLSAGVDSADRTARGKADTLFEEPRRSRGVASVADVNERNRFLTKVTTRRCLGTHNFVEHIRTDITLMLISAAAK